SRFRGSADSPRRGGLTTRAGSAESRAAKINPQGRPSSASPMMIYGPCATAIPPMRALCNFSSPHHDPGAVGSDNILRAVGAPVVGQHDLYHLPGRPRGVGECLRPCIMFDVTPRRGSVFFMTSAWSSAGAVGRKKLWRRGGSID